MTERGNGESPGGCRLAHLPGFGHVRRCERGCFHLACTGVTLDFPNDASFRRFSERLRAHRRGLADVELRYGPALLRFAPDEFDRLVQLVQASVTRWELLEELCDRPAA